MKQKIGVLGTGMVGQVLATGFLDHGHDVMIGTRTPQKLEEWLDKNPTGRVGGHRETGAWADLLVLAAKGSAAETVVRLLDSKDVQGKIIIDATNPLADAPPENGVLKYFTSLENSLMEQLQAAQPGARFVKAFNSVGNAYMVDPKFEEGRPTMFICGNDAEAKGTVAALLNSFGWDAEDMGGVEAARAIEPLCMLWCLPGFTRNQWSHAFKLLKR
ncbi:MAG: NAD(P)-binding domain-containing protein [Bacteroidetes bacterium]|jgi:predicted dinucleotide-binding enzyme|nr:NAD(P)-binding domain-containing protein [Bacteroidota bacterium]MBX7127788.1 NAD(P)-binding domain-containing protein [Flavobacteriales bacterium]MCC6653722.1 NAD(P)-binding domain-containing protein [Flavobacteriales bacterium]HMU15302.1 NAD(P)-binding domain-containing protein [Flavobacteriales bacterium]HMZ48698.1 NAD(P)-binding domain-containing protein [Flavobacteriales bacterium]